MNIDKISIKNFRVFKEKTGFLLRPFTILTGPNNSGKSSFTKFLLLLKEGSSELSFTQGNHNLKDYSSIINWEKKEEPLEFEIAVNESEIIKYQYYSEYLNEIKYTNSNKDIIQFSKKILTYEPDDIEPFETNKLLLSINLDIDYFIKNELETEKDVVGMYYDDVMTYDWKVWNEGLLFKILVNDEDVTLQYVKLIRELQRELFKVEYELSQDNIFMDFYELFSNQIEYLINYCKENLAENLVGEFSDFTENNLKIEFSDFGSNLLQTSFSKSHMSNNRNFIISWIFNMLNLKKFTESINYLSPNRGNQKRVLMNQSDKDIDSIIVSFSKRKNIQIDFIKKCFSILGIEGDLEVNRYENTISTVRLVNNGEKLALADLGFGYSQIIPIILKIHNFLPDTEVNVLKKQRRNQNLKDINFGFLILEEPEANLHPNLQAKLAELLVYIQTIINIKFIIETHSEYFIRKLQYLSAKNDLKTEDSVVYYFNDDKYVSKSEPKVKEIFINEDGGLTDSFGPGFFDEATKLQFDLIRLQKQQFN